MREYREQATLQPSQHEDIKPYNGETHNYHKGNGEAREYHKSMEVDPIHS